VLPQTSVWLCIVRATADLRIHFSSWSGWGMSMSKHTMAHGLNGGMTR